ncbi:MAG: type II toxin-antitoxin system HicA family toxin [Verrucomicrobiota bacterium]|nr:type II toxin-antitoxin system HicA family toxin [Verrucomicrobiota bacterium]
MPKPISRREMIRQLRELGWSGPYPGGKHSIMQKENQTVHIPNPHGGDIDWSLTKRI